MPAHPVKMFGQHWFVFDVADNGCDLPSAITGGSMETLPMQLVSRIQAQQYMKLSDMLALFMGVAVSLQLFHHMGFAHGNLDSCNVLCPRLPTSSAEHAVPTDGQPIVLSAFGVTPFHRNPLFRAPETKHSREDASIASDLWALGVIFWDITNYGMAPMYGVARDAETAGEDGEAAFDKVCAGDTHLGCPENCPQVVHQDLIAPLLQANPLLRPSIETVIATIHGLMQQ
jgi:serine/threonine protein kinase